MEADEDRLVNRCARWSAMGALIATSLCLALAAILWPVSRDPKPIRVDVHIEGQMTHGRAK
jgi:hypothetical protein